MCAIVGFLSDDPRPEDADRLLALVRESKIRGLHAFGLATISEGRKTWTVDKTLSLAEIEAAIQLRASGELPGFQRLMFHARYSTSGDFRDPANNQPIVARSGILVFNGTIHMGTKEEREQAFGETFETDNDGEIVLAKLSRGEDVDRYVRKTRITFAGIYNYGRDLLVLRNEHRPAWSWGDGRTAFVASTRDIFRRAGFDDPKEIPAGRSINLKDLR